MRFYFENSLEYFVENLAAHFSDLAIDPSPFELAPAVWNLISETAVHVAREAPNGTLVWKRPKDSVPPPGLAGELIRSVLTGMSYPRSLLARIIDRVRSERGRVTGTRAAICKAVVNRDLRLRRSNPQLETSHPHGEISVALDRANPHPAYRLGRLFALMERTQQLASEPRRLNATIRDRFFGSASTTPARVFPLLVRSAMHHASTAQKEKGKRSRAFWLERETGEVWSGLEADLPKILTLENQGRFQVGYYHQRFARKDAAGAENLAAAEDVDESNTDAAEE